MDNVELWQEAVKWVLGGLGAAGAFFGKRAIKKHDDLNEMVSALDKRIILQDKAMVEAELKASRTFVDKTDYVRLENKIDSVAASLTGKIDKVADNVQELVNKLLTKV